MFFKTVFDILKHAQKNDSNISIIDFSCNNFNIHTYSLFITSFFRKNNSPEEGG